LRGIIVWCCVFLDLMLYIVVAFSLIVCAWVAVCRFVLGVSSFVFSLLRLCSVGVVELYVVNGGGFMV
jgi:DMSO/TMAO reductase YedYZ heme-binding membrane subunit